MPDGEEKDMQIGKGNKKEGVVECVESSITEASLNRNVLTC